jgi:hypothetical protein
MVFKSNLISKIIRFCISLLFIFVIYQIVMVLFQKIQQKTYMEGFLSSGDYPVAVDKPLLYSNYNVVDKPGASPLGAAQIYVDYPIFSASSTKINNLRYWDTPTDGMCTAPDMCNNLYKPTKQKMFVPSCPPAWNNERRVNYQVTNINTNS